jgi:hypothetical protein
MSNSRIASATLIARSEGDGRIISPEEVASYVPANNDFRRELYRNKRGRFFFAEFYVGERPLFRWTSEEAARAWMSTHGVEIVATKS